MNITANDLLEIYRRGFFPMADDAQDEKFFICEPKERSILPFKDLHISKSLRKKVLKSEFEIRVNTAFNDVIEKCGEATPSRANTWINHSIKSLFNKLHLQGHAHSVESWKDDKLVGGLYGLQLGAAFWGESMFSRATDASKVALVHLCARLKATGFTLLDAQLENPHLAQFGQQIIAQEEYRQLLDQALQTNPNFSGTNKAEITLVREYLTPDYK